MTCEKEKYDDVISQMKKVHPYEEPAYEL